jgi:FixJ family two-component response regulator
LKPELPTVNNSSIRGFSSFEHGCDEHRGTLATAILKFFRNSQISSVETIEVKTIDPIVYLIEDDEGSRESTTCLLGVFQFHVRSFESAEQFFSEVTEHPVGCILTDLNLPGMSGLELLHKVRQSGWTTPVIFLTAFGDVPTVVDAFKSGVHDFFEKPFLPQRLIKSVSECMLLSREQSSRRAQ